MSHIDLDTEVCFLCYKDIKGMVNRAKMMLDVNCA
jgi:hypothetical protein